MPSVRIAGWAANITVVAVRYSGFLGSNVAIAHASAGSERCFTAISRIASANGADFRN
ncbi:hypothetical protein GCM10007858_46640 [Bradyrhizobium liaoningense]|nr:hypothetical protein GCM10007858_46640 [Bradyrhizobium liaoningense]